MNFITRITGIALFDGINPTIILLTIYLLAGYRPKARVPVYLLSIYVTNLSLGVLVYFFIGINKFNTLFQLIYLKNPWLYLAKAILSVVLIIAAYNIDIHKTREIKKKPGGAGGILTVIALGFIGTIIEFSTAASYVVGLKVLANKKVDTSFALLSLAYYNLIYILIPLIIFIIYLNNRHQAKEIIERMHQKSSYYLNHFFRISILIIGLVLALDSLSYAIRSPFVYGLIHKMH